MTLFATWEKENKNILAAYAMNFFVDWKEEKYFCAECKEQLIPFKDSIKTNEQGTKYFVAPHFAHKSDSTCIFAKGEGEEHKSEKAKILSFLYLEKAIVKIHKLKTIIPKELIVGSEIKRGENRADILIEFNEFNPFFGNGIAIEIMKSETQVSIEEKKHQWLKKGYVVIENFYESEGTLFLVLKNFYIEQLFKEVEEKLVQLKKITFDGSQKLTNQVEESIEQLEAVAGQQDTEIESLNTKINHAFSLLQRVENIQIREFTKTSNNCSNCKQSSVDNKIPTRLCCWLKFHKRQLQFPEYTDNQFICNFWGVRV